MMNLNRTRPAVFAAVVLAALAPARSANADDSALRPTLGPYVLLGWNDLGMHCSNKFFADLAVLPPFNTVWATLIKRGDASHMPQKLGATYTVRYRFDANTYSVGKTDFWSYEDQLFGVQLPNNVGLTGKGLTGTLDWTADHFEAVGIPLTPYDDADLLHERPFQLAQLDAYDGQNNLLASTEIVAPVSNEMTCNACHHPEQGQTVDQAILRLHDEENGTNLMGNRPVLCADCHASNALGMPGNPNLPSLSLAMHEKHAEYTNDCYKCHPGPNTQCLRDVMNTQYGITCQNCHGSMSQVAHSIDQGRRPWLDEPRCQTCHGNNYAEEPGTLYRMSNNGHGGLYCSACHNSPHAILPSREERDNRQVAALQGHAGTLSDCTVCHGVTPSAPGPHGYWPTGLQDPNSAQAGVARVIAAPNPMTNTTEIQYRTVGSDPIRLEIRDVVGRPVRVLTDRSQRPGDHTLVWDGRDDGGREAPDGVYFCRLTTGGQTASSRVVKATR